MPLNCRSVKTLYLDESGDHGLLELLLTILRLDKNTR